MLWTFSTLSKIERCVCLIPSDTEHPAHFSLRFIICSRRHGGMNVAFRLHLLEHGNVFLQHRLPLNIPLKLSSTWIMCCPCCFFSFFNCHALNRFCRSPKHMLKNEWNCAVWRRSVLCRLSWILDLRKVLALLPQPLMNFDWMQAFSPNLCVFFTNSTMAPKWMFFKRHSKSNCCLLII